MDKNIIEFEFYKVPIAFRLELDSILDLNHPNSDWDFSTEPGLTVIYRSGAIDSDYVSIEGNSIYLRLQPEGVGTRTQFHQLVGYVDDIIENILDICNDRLPDESFSEGEYHSICDVMLTFEFYDLAYDYDTDEWDYDPDPRLLLNDSIVLKVDNEYIS